MTVRPFWLNIKKSYLPGIYIVQAANNENVTCFFKLVENPTLDPDLIHHQLDVNDADIGDFYQRIGFIT